MDTGYNGKQTDILWRICTTEIRPDFAGRGERRSEDFALHERRDVHNQTCPMPHFPRHVDDWVKESLGRILEEMDESAGEDDPRDEVLAHEEDSGDLY